MKTIRLHSILIAALLSLGWTGRSAAVEVPGAAALADLISSHFDTNGDAKIDTGEWQAGAAGSFDEIDTDRDGRLTTSDIDALAGPIRKEAGSAAGSLVPKLIKPLILGMDVDGDGVVSAEEFGKKMDELFTKLDANKDAELRRPELVDLPMRMIAPAK